MGQLTQVKNGKYIGADKYTITDTSDGKKQVVFSPDSVLEEGTPVGAEILNEIQKNGLYYLVGTHRVDGQESIYDCTLVGIDTFEFEQLNVLFKPNTTPTQATVKLNISGQVFTLTEKLINAIQIGLLLVKSEMKAYTWGTKIAIVNDLTTGGADKAGSAEMIKKLGTDKLDKGAFKGDAQDLKNNIDSNMGTVQDGEFPLTQADVGKTYRAGNGKLYKCVTAYSGSEIGLPNDSFEELSIHNNYNKFSNISNILKFKEISNLPSPSLNTQFTFDEKQYVGYIFEAERDGTLTPTSFWIREQLVEGRQCNVVCDEQHYLRIKKISDRTWQIVNWNYSWKNFKIYAIV